MELSFFNKRHQSPKRVKRVDVTSDSAYTGAVALAHDGKVSRANRTRPQLLMATLMQAIPMMFITMPVLACKGAETRREEGERL